MAWHAVYQKADGKLVSVATIVPRLPATLASVELGERKPDWGVLQWDPSTLGMTTKPPRPSQVDRVNDLVARTPTVDARLTVATRTALRTEVARLLGPYRYRDSDAPVEL